MPGHYKIKNFSIGKRLFLLCLFIICAFGINVGIMVSASGNIRNLINTIVAQDIDIVLQNSQLTRSLSSILAKTSFYVTTFHLNPEGSDNLPERIESELDAILEQEMDQDMRRHLVQYRSSLMELFTLGEKISGKLLKVQELNALTQSLFLKLEEHISQMIVQLVLDGEESLVYEQIGAIIPSYREMLTEVSLIFSRFKPTFDNSAQAIAIKESLSNLHLRLRTLLASDIEISSLGQALMDTVQELDGLYGSIWVEQKNLIKKITELEHEQEKTLSIMDSTDLATKNAAVTINNTINRISNNSIQSIAFLSFIVALIVGAMTFLFLHFQIRRPMRLLTEGIKLVGEGKLKTKIRLERDDEWQTIENAINNMTGELATSYENLHKSNYELSKLNIEIEGRSSLLEKEIEQRKLVEGALVLSEERYRRFFEDDLSGSFIASPEGALLASNPAFNKMFHLEAINKAAIANLRDIFPDPKVVGELLVNLQVKNNIHFKESEFVRHDGSVIYASATFTGTFAEDGTLLEIKGQLIDETIRRQAEKKSIALEEQLQHARKMEAIGTLAGGVAHDLNNILSGIVSYPDLLLLKMKPDDPHRKIILTIQESGNKAAAIVQDLLTLARRGVALKEVVNVNQIITDYLGTPEYNMLITHHPGVDVRLDLAEELRNIDGIKFHLSKTVMNLVANGVEAIENQGVVTIKTVNQTVGSRGSKEMNLAPGEYIVISVSDTGKGIEEENKNRIFEPFYSSKEMGRSGSGLGLAVVWGAVQDHDGYIEVESVKDKGTTFTIFLPVTHKKPEETFTVPANIEYSGNGERILVVDDTTSQREIASEMLQEIGYSVDSVASGEEAIDFLKTNEVDCLLLDMIMAPGMDGLETYMRILDFKPDQKAILTSGYSETSRVKEARQAGATIYLKKPYSVEQLGLALKQELAA